MVKTRPSAVAARLVALLGYLMVLLERLMLVRLMVLLERLMLVRPVVLEPLLVLLVPEPLLVLEPVLVLLVLEPQLVLLVLEPLLELAATRRTVAKAVGPPRGGPPELLQVMADTTERLELVATLIQRRNRSHVKTRFHRFPFRSC